MNKRGNTAGYRIATGLAMILLISSWIGGLTDPYKRLRFEIHSSEGKRIAGVVVYRKPVPPDHLLVYAHGSEGSIEYDGAFLRMAADHGLSAVSFDYSKDHSGSFIDELSMVVQYTRELLKTDSITQVWVGFSLGFEHMINAVEEDQELNVEAMVGISASVDSSKVRLRQHPDFPILMLHGTEDIQVPYEKIEQFSESFLKSDTEVRIIPMRGHGHNLYPDKKVAYKTALEFACTNLDISHFPKPYLESGMARYIPIGAGMLAAISITGLLWTWKYRNPDRKAARAVLFLFAILISSAAYYFQNGLNLFIHRAIIHRHLGTSEEGADKVYLDSIETDPIEMKRAIREFRREDWNRRVLHSNWNEISYQDDPESAEAYSVGRHTGFSNQNLWESLAGRVKKSADAMDAARSVVRFLRVSNQTGFHRNQLEDKASIEAGRRHFDGLYRHSLKLLGIPTRFISGQLEIRDQGHWKTAPRPVIEIHQFRTNHSTLPGANETSRIMR